MVEKVPNTGLYITNAAALTPKKGVFVLFIGDHLAMKVRKYDDNLAVNWTLDWATQHFQRPDEGLLHIMVKTIPNGENLPDVEPYKCIPHLEQSYHGLDEVEFKQNIPVVRYARGIDLPIKNAPTKEEVEIANNPDYDTVIIVTLKKK